MTDQKETAVDLFRRGIRSVLEQRGFHGTRLEAKIIEVEQQPRIRRVIAMLDAESTDSEHE